MSRLNDAALDHLRRVADWPELEGDRYQVQAVLGQGGMGTVYRVYDRVLDREVALKVLRPEMSSAEWTRRLGRESQVLARLEHPGIVPVHDVAILADGRTGYFMRLVAGQRLDQLPASAPQADRLRFFLRICDTIEFAHSRGVIHRDLKPSNIMLGAFGEVLVLDWGIARVAHLAEDPVDPSPPHSPDPGHTAPGTVMGTPGFMAPEGAGGQVDQRTDIFALGAILRLLLAGTADSAPAKPLAAIAARASAPVPSDRYPTVRALASDLTKYLDGAPVEAYQEPLNERLARIYTKYQVPVLLVLAYLVMRLLFLVFRRA